PVGRGRPHTQVVERPRPEDPPTDGDDAPWNWGWIVSGPNGLADTTSERLGPDWQLVVPYGHGQANGRAYFVARSPDYIELEGDDIIHDDFLLTGADGILQTPPQFGLTDDYYTTPIKVGEGLATQYQNSILAIPVPRLSASTLVAGDDNAHLFGVTSGADGIAAATAAGQDQQLIPVGQGQPNVPCVGPGSDGQLNTVPAGDDTLLDYASYYAGREPAGSLVGLTAWPNELVQAQGGLHSPRLFATHTVVNVNNRLYDPSYGAGPFNNTDEWVQQNVASTSVNTGFQVDGKFVGETFSPEVLSVPWVIAP
ncbi:MAG: hypothetical protein AB8H79_10670, partial [Myxococcota bacterium]